ncbi:hypothetical protein [Methanofollis fontis]|uniref:Lipoprotein n=1 Tax=Methanofollis fontis TaxID=2052832 RepID=A0A483CUT5_9EURY|nr:hypothetical protein [Methanofollis fontis]TAJ45386.1 hypothetical protein CUJ86_01180 [Methanofollis fontis]
MKPAPLPLLLSLGILLLVTMTGGCTSEPGAPAAPSGAGIEDITQEAPDEAIDLAEALAELDMLAAEGMENITDMTIHTITGTGVTADGTAPTWIMGVRKEGETHMLVYSGNGWSGVAWTAPLPEGEIDPETVLMPADLYRIQKEEIGGLGETTDLTLEEGVYTVRGHATRPGTLRFDALTGEVLQ